MIDPFRTGRAYTVTQAARLADTSPQNVARWLRGYGTTEHRMASGYGPGGAEAPRTISFLELAEVIVVARFRRCDPQGRRRVSLDTLRRAHEYAGRVFRLEYPFASLNLKIEGGHTLHEFDLANPGDGTIAVDAGGQWALPFPVRKELDLFDFDPADYLARRWFPLGRNGHIVVDPHIAAGQPVIAGTRVTVDVINKRFLSNESIKAIAEDFEIGITDVEQALRYAAA